MRSLKLTLAAALAALTVQCGSVAPAFAQSAQT